VAVAAREFCLSTGKREAMAEREQRRRYYASKGSDRQELKNWLKMREKGATTGLRSCLKGFDFVSSAPGKLDV